MNVKLERWLEASESKGFKISHAKAKYMNCIFSGNVQKVETPIRIEGQWIPQRDSF